MNENALNDAPETSPRAIPGLVIAETRTEWAALREGETMANAVYPSRLAAEEDRDWMQRRYPFTFRVVSRQVFTTEWAEQ